MWDTIMWEWDIVGPFYEKSRPPIYSILDYVMQNDNMYI